MISKVKSNTKYRYALNQPSELPLDCNYPAINVEDHLMLPVFIVNLSCCGPAFSLK